MSTVDFSKMPALAKVSEHDRVEISRAIEGLEKSDLEHHGLWAVIENKVPGATLLQVDAELEGVFQVPGQESYVAIGDVSVSAPGAGSPVSISTIVFARKEDQKIIVEKLSAGRVKAF